MGLNDFLTNLGWLDWLRIFKIFTVMFFINWYEDVKEISFEHAFSNIYFCMQLQKKKKTGVVFKKNLLTIRSFYNNKNQTG